MLPKQIVICKFVDWLSNNFKNSTLFITKCFNSKHDDHPWRVLSTSILTPCRKPKHPDHGLNATIAMIHFLLVGCTAIMSLSVHHSIYLPERKPLPSHFIRPQLQLHMLLLWQEEDLHLLVVATPPTIHPTRWPWGPNQHLIIRIRRLNK